MCILIDDLQYRNVEGLGSLVHANLKQKWSLHYITADSTVHLTVKKATKIPEYPSLDCCISGYLLLEETESRVQSVRKSWLYFSFTLFGMIPQYPVPSPSGKNPDHDGLLYFGWE